MCSSHEGVDHDEVEVDYRIELHGLYLGYLGC